MIKRYSKFIESRKNRVLPEGVYTESHHILPRCLGGSNDSDNLIDLTAREHYIAHKMLYRENKSDRKLINAFMMMCGAKSPTQIRDYEITSRDFETARIALSESMRGENNPMYGKFGEDNPKYGIPRTDDVKKKLSVANTGNHPREGKSEEELQEWNSNLSKATTNVWANRTDEEKAAIIEKTAKKNRGKALSPEHRAGISRGNSNPLKVTNLITNDIKKFPNSVCDECREYLGFKTSNSCNVAVSRAMNNNNGFIRKGRGRNSYNAFYIEYL